MLSHSFPICCLGRMEDEVERMSPWSQIEKHQTGLIDGMGPLIGTYIFYHLYLMHAFQTLSEYSTSCFIQMSNRRHSHRQHPMKHEGY